jgi:hypothetical protein
MLQQLTATQSECLEHAVLCRARAEAVSDPIDKTDFLLMAECWELLATSYGCCDRLSDFIASRKTVSRNVQREPNAASAGVLLHVLPPESDGSPPQLQEGGQSSRS